MSNSVRTWLLLVVTVAGAWASRLVVAEPSADAPYTADWESLSKHKQAPDWLADGKLGIYFHWGVYTVPAYGSEWYPRTMHLVGDRVFKHHVKNYGDPANYPYHKFVPQFKAEKFDATEWADLFQAAGATFAGPVAQHHDGFAMWASDVNPWNVGDRGPQRDITGELASELRKRDMKLITTFHHSRLLQRNADKPDEWGGTPGAGRGYDSHYPYNPAWATSSTDPELAKLYGNMPADEFHKYWGDQVKEVIDKYSPDMIWFDSWLNLIPEAERQDLAAYYYNNARRLGKEVTIGFKQDDYPLSVGVMDIEQGGKKDIAESVWMTDVTLSLGSWSYIEGQKYKDAALVIRNMIDVWSKNGVVLLNISPMSDGSIPAAQQKVLREIGQWLDTHGEAVYGTHPHTIYGHGSAKAGDGGHGGQSATTKYSAGDVRYTLAKDNSAMYVFFLGRPEPGQKIRMNHLGKHRYNPPTPITRVTVLGSGEEVEWQQGNTELDIVIPDAPMNELATVFKFELE